MRVVVAGTFGPIHDGHRELFRHALEFGSDGVVVGLTSDELATETRSEPRPIPPFEQRREVVHETVEAMNEWDRPVAVERITGRHDLAVTDESLDGIVLSPETAEELAAINDRRRDRGHEPLTGIVAPYVLAADGDRISSTRIVAGEIDEHGETR